MWYIHDTLTVMHGGVPHDGLNRRSNPRTEGFHYITIVSTLILDFPQHSNKNGSVVDSASGFEARTEETASESLKDIDKGSNGSQTGTNSRTIGERERKRGILVQKESSERKFLNRCQCLACRHQNLMPRPKLDGVLLG